MSSREAREATDLQRRREAAKWFAEHEAAQELSQARLPAWEDWMDDASNRAEYVAMVGLRRDVQALGRTLLPSANALLDDSFDVDRPPVSAARESTGSAVRPACASWRWMPFAMAAGVAFLACLIVWPLAYRLSSSSRSILEPAQAYATGAGEQRAFTLSDGSEMTLAGNTAAVVRFTATGRSVVLNRGEGLFHVQHDPSRPFLVCAAQACVTAVGTIFDVHLYSDRVRVWVQEGTVEVAPMRPAAVSDEVIRSGPRWSPLRLQHGQEMSYAADGDASAPGPADARAAAAWTRGSLIYHDRLLSEVIEDVQRYSVRPILLDPAVADLHYSGSVIQQHADQWIQGLSDIFPVDIVDCRALSQTASADQAGPRSCGAAPNRILIRARIMP